MPRESAIRLAVDSTVCLVDAEHYPLLDFASGELAISQAAVSDIVLLNKCDLVSESAAQAIERDLLGALPAMRVLRTSGARIAWPILLGLPRSQRSSAHNHAHGPGFQSWSWRSAEPIPLEAFREIASAPPAHDPARQGHPAFHLCGERAVFQLVGKRSSLTLGPQDGDGTSALVLIGPEGSFPAAALDDLFASLLVPAEDHSQIQTQTQAQTQTQTQAKPKPKPKPETQNQTQSQTQTQTHVVIPPASSQRWSVSGSDASLVKGTHNKKSG